MTPKFVTVGDDLKIREDHIPERLSDTSISSVAQSAAISAAQSMPGVSGVAQYARPNRPDPEHLELFQPGHGWEGLGAGRAEYIPDDTTRHWRGEQCTTIITTPTGELSSTLRKNGGFPTTSITGKALRVSLKIDRPDLVQRIQVRWGTSHLDGYVWRIWPGELLPDEPKEFTLPLGSIIMAEGTVTLGPDGAPSTTEGFNTVSVLVRTVDGGRTEPVTMSVQSIEIIPDPADTFPTGCISVTFDDGWQDVYDLGKPIMDKHGVRTTQYVMASWIDSEVTAYMGREHLQEFHRDGHEIAMHAYDHTLHSRPLGYQDATEQEIRDDFAAGREWLLEQGFPAESFAYPKGQDLALSSDPDVAVRDIVPAYFQTGRLIRSGVMTTPPADLSTINALTGVGEGRVGATPADLTAPGGLIDSVRATGGWLVLVFHHISEGPATTDMYCSQDGFDQILGYMREVGVETLPVREAVQRIINRT